MKHRSFVPTLLGLSVAAALPCLAQADSSREESSTADESSPAGSTDDARLAALEKAAQSLVEAFNQRDAAAIAATYLPDGELTLSSGEILTGREVIEEYYAGLFEEAGDGAPVAAVEAGEVHFAAPSIAIENGVFHLTANDGEVSSHGYSAVLVQQQDGSWLAATVRGEKDDTALPDEKLLGLDWIVGDWLIENDGSRTYIAFNWSDDGPYIDARALTEESGVESTASTLRIGWDPRRDGYVSWHFDAQGGFSFNEWTEAEADRYLIRSLGVTADGEPQRGTILLELGDDGQSFTWTTRDKVIGDEVLPEATLKVVKRPPAPKAAATSE